MPLTIRQHIFHKLQILQPLTEQQLKIAIEKQVVNISIQDLKSELAVLIKNDWLRYHNVENNINPTYELSNRWYGKEKTNTEKNMYTTPQLKDLRKYRFTYQKNL